MVLGVALLTECGARQLRGRTQKGFVCFPRQPTRKVQKRQRRKVLRQKRRRRKVQDECTKGAVVWLRCVETLHRKWAQSLKAALRVVHGLRFPLHQV